MSTATTAALPAILVLSSSIVINAVFGLIVLTRTYRKAYGWYFAATMLGIAAWSLGDILMLLARDPQVVHFWAEVFYIAPMVIPVSIWFFATSFPENRRPKPWQMILAAVTFALLAVLFLFNFDFVIKDIIVKRPLNIATPAPAGFLLYTSYFSLFFMLTYVTFWLKVRALSGLSRTQVTYTFYGAFGASVPALITNLSLPMLGVKDIIWLGPIFTLLFAASVTIAIVKHRLFDIRWVVARSLAYIASLIILATAYGFIVFGIAQAVFDLHFSITAQILLSAATGVAALSFNYLRKSFDRATNRLFYRDAYDPQEFLNEFNKVLVSTIDLESLLHGATQTIAKYLKAQYCLIGIKDGSTGQRIFGTHERNFSQEEILQLRRITPHIHQSVIVTDDISAEHERLHQLLAKNNIAVLARITDSVQEAREGQGYIVLGPKKSGYPYGSQDGRVLEVVANELVIAIQNALRFEEIEQFNETLQQRVETATRKLRKTNEKLRLLDETKDDFIGMASHQLRTPLTSVKGYLSLVLDGDAGPVKPAQGKLLNQAYISSQRMVYLIADLLNVSRLRTGKFVIEPSPVNLANLIEDEISQVADMAHGRSLTLTYHKPPHFPTLNLDETKTRQVVMNFIDNAIHYTPPGGHITVSLEDKPETVELRVIDDGIGVPKIDQHHLFTKFYRAKNAQKARPDGTGLGLFMAKKVIVAQGGATIFDSKEGKGSTFGFSFPKAALAHQTKQKTLEALKLQ